MKVFVLLAVICFVINNSAFSSEIRKTTLPGRLQAHTIREIYANEGSGRIISGLAAVLGQFPWQAGIIATGSGGSYICGGSLLSNEWILTAAHCIIDMTTFTIHLGGLTLANNEAGKTIATATEYIAHPNYNNYYNNDIGLIRLNSAIEYTETIQPIRLPINGSSVQTGTVLTVSGWGKTSDASTTASSTLQWTLVTSIANELCASIYAADYVVDTTLCTIGSPNNGTCSGDSGGPLVLYDNDGVASHEGVVSFGADNACEAGYPSGFVRTADYLDWIAETTGLQIPNINIL